MNTIQKIIPLVVFGFAVAVLTGSCDDKPATDNFGLTGPAFVKEESVSLRAPAPKVYMRLTNQTQANGVTKYDAEFRSDEPGTRLDGMNVRIWVPASQFAWLGMTDFADGYAASPPNPAQVSTGGASSGPAIFGFPGAARYVNGAVQLVNVSAPPIYLDAWTKLFAVQFLGTPACPIVILDKEKDPFAGGFYVNDGITITCYTGGQYPVPTTEYVEYIGWNQTQAKMPFGAPTPCQ